MAAQQLILNMTGRGGLAKKWGGDINFHGYNDYDQSGAPNLRYDSGEDQMVAGVYNPVTKYGYLSPTPNTFLELVESDTISEEITVRLVDDKEDIIWFANEDNIYSSGYANGKLSSQASFSSAVTIYTDMAIYYLNGVRTGFLAARTSTASIIKTFALTGSISLNEDWSSSDVTNSFNLYQSYNTKLIPSGDGFMYVLNKNAVHRIDGTTVGGTNGTIYKDILKGPTDTFLTHGVEYRNRLYIAVQTTEEWRQTTGGLSPSATGNSTSINQVGIYVWNRQASFFNSSDFIALPGVSNLRQMWVSPKNELFVMVLTATHEVEIRKFNGTSFQVVEQLPYGAHVNHDHALMVYGNYVYWLGTDGYIYMYGSEFANEKDALYIIGQYSDDGVGGPGPMVIALSNATSSAFAGNANEKKAIDTMWLVGEFDSSSSTITPKQFFPFANNTVSSAYDPFDPLVTNIARHPGNIYTPVKFLPTLSNVKHINIIMAPNSSVSGVQVEAVVKIYFNQSTTAWASKNITRDDINKGYVSIEVNKPYVNSIQLETEYNTNSNIGVADFNPVYAEVIYEPTTTLR